MGDKFFAAASMGAALVASLCCIGPVMLGGLGLGAALASTFEPLRPYFLAGTVVLLALGFYALYRKPAAKEACEGEVCAPGGQPKRAAKAMLWLATVVVLALALFPYYGGELISAAAAKNAVVDGARLTMVDLKINGMSCEACAGTVEYVLRETPGVAEAEVDYSTGRATVQYDPDQTDTAKLIKAVDAAGYKASLLPEQQE